MPPRRTTAHWPAMLIFAAASFLTAALGGWGTSLGTGPWYDALSKPPWTPPSWVFGPVWTCLYVLLAASPWLAWRRAGWAAGRAYVVHFGQLAVHVAFSWTFFALKSPFLGALSVCVATGLAALTIWQFARFSTPAALLQAPLLAWLLYASTVALGVVGLN